MGKVTDKGMQAALNRAKAAEAKPAPVVAKTPAPVKPTPAKPVERKPAHILAREELGWQGTPKSKGFVSDTIDTVEREFHKAKKIAEDYGKTYKGAYDSLIKGLGGKK